MSSINKILFLLYPSCLLAYIVSWQTRNFELLCLGSTLFLLAITINFKFLRNLTLPTTAILLTLTIAEFSASLFLSSQKKVKFETESGHSSGEYWDFIPGYGYKVLPGVYLSKKLTSKGEIIYDVSYKIGQDGYRQDVKADNYDAYIYGGSFTFGEGLNDDETISYFLFKNHNVFVKNLGVHGYGLHQALSQIKNGVTSKMPNGINILLTAPWHSLRSSCKPRYAVGTPRYIFENGFLRQDGLCDAGSIIYRTFIKSNIVKLLKLDIKKDQNVITNEDIELYIEIIKEIKKLSVENKASLVIAYIDASEELLSKTRYTNESLLTELQLIGDSVIDVTLAENFEDLDPKFYLHKLDKHPTSIANENRAELISEIFK